MGADNTPITDVSLQSWTDALCDLIDQETEPVILVGHSRAGLNISQTAEQRPDWIKMLVYLCAMLLRDGETGLGVTTSHPDSQVGQNLIVAEDGTSATLKEESVRELFFGDCSDEDVEWARSLLSPEPLAPVSTPVSITDDNFGRVRRIYIETLADKAVPPSLQKQMYEALPCERVISMSTSHSPFFSAPEELVKHLLAIDYSQKMMPRALSTRFGRSTNNFLITHACLRTLPGTCSASPSIRLSVLVTAMMTCPNRKLPSSLQRCRPPTCSSCIR